MQLPQRSAVFTVAILLLMSSSYGATSSMPFNTDEQDAQFIGFYINPTGTTRFSAQSAWVTSGYYAGDCPDLNGPTCSVATQCVDKTLTFNDGGTSSCEGFMSCNTFMIYHTSPNGLPSATNIACRSNWAADTFYRELNQPTISSGASPPSSHRPVITMTTKRLTRTTKVRLTRTTTNTPTTSVRSTPTNTTPSSQNKSWIAGVVIGPIAAIALVVLVLWLVPLCRGRPGLVQHLLGYWPPGTATRGAVRAR